MNRYDFLSWFIRPKIIENETTCPFCNGHGYTITHNPSENAAPIHWVCNPCKGTGKVETVPHHPDLF